MITEAMDIDTTKNMITNKSAQILSCANDDIDFVGKIISNIESVCQRLEREAILRVNADKTKCILSSRNESH